MWDNGFRWHKLSKSSKFKFALKFWILDFLVSKIQNLRSFEPLKCLSPIMQHMSYYYFLLLMKKGFFRQPFLHAAILILKIWMPNFLFSAWKICTEPQQMNQLTWKLHGNFFIHFRQIYFFPRLIAQIFLYFREGAKWLCRGTWYLKQSYLRYNLQLIIISCLLKNYIPSLPLALIGKSL